MVSRASERKRPAFSVGCNDVLACVLKQSRNNNNKLNALEWWDSFGSKTMKWTAKALLFDEE